MVTHHVNPRRACPAPKGVACITGRRFSTGSRSSAWHHVQDTLVPLPVGTIYHGTAKHRYWIGEVQNAYRYIFAQQGANGNADRTFAA